MLLAGVDPEELKPESKSQGPRTPRSRWENFWYHYKWAFWGCLFGVVVLTVLVVQLVTRDPLTVEQAREAVKNAPGCVLIEDLNGRNYPTPLDTTDQDLVYVGRIRRDLLDDERGLTLWCCGDQVRKGAATNCVQIAELFVK